MGIENAVTNGFGVTDKGSSLPIDSDFVGLDLKLQSAESFPEMVMMMMMGHHHRPFSPLQTVCGGPTCNYSGANEVVLGCCSTLIYGDDHEDDAAPAKVVGVGTGGSVAVRTLQQPFQISSTTSSTYGYTTPKSPGGMAATLGHPPFTSAQWKELERQAMIYKYMVASLPVPPALFLPFAQNFSPADSSASHSSLDGGSILNLKFASSKDPEPGRCKRTDGKKWRCSRDVAPQQKYCERHMNRGRTRSRKPVEVHHPPINNDNNKKKTRLHHAHLPTSPAALSNSSPQIMRSSIPFPLDEPNNRGLDWMMEREMVAMDMSEQQWIAEGSIYNSSCSIFQQHYGEEESNALLSLPYNGNSQHNDGYNLLLNPEFVALDNQTPRDFIDAWTNDNPYTENNNNESSSAYGNLSPSSLNLSMSMAVGSAIDEEMGMDQMGLGVVRDSDNDNKTQVSSWLSHVPSTPGGPLAEVLRHSSAAIGSNPGSPYATVGDNGDASSPRAAATPVSSVVQRTVPTLSDSSVYNSPTTERKLFGSSGRLE